MYAADFQLQLMERKVARASGHRTPLEQKELKQKIAELTEALDKQNQQHSMASRPPATHASDTNFNLKLHGVQPLHIHSYTLTLTLFAPFQ